MAIHQPLYRVIHIDGGWTVVDHSGARLTGLLQTPAEGVVRAKELAVREGSGQIVVQDRDGRVVSDFMHQREERPSMRNDESGSDSLSASRPVTRGSRPSHV